MTRALRSGALAALVTAGLVLLATPPAEAGDEFERAFRDELGRIAAHEAVGLGRHLLGEVLHVEYGHRAHRGRGIHRGHPRHGRYSRTSEPPRRWRRYRRHRQDDYFRYDRYRDHRRHERRRHHRRHRGCDWH